MNLSIELLNALKTAGVRHLFGIPGDFILPFFEQVEHHSILPLITLSHEPGVGFAADAAARISGGLSAMAVTYGAGALNSVNAIAGAFAERSPLFVVAGCPSESERGSGFLLHHQAKTLDSQYRIFSEITCDQARITDAASAPEKIARLIRSAQSYSQPVLLELPRDLATLPCEPVAVLPPLDFESGAVQACAAEVLTQLQQADNPVLVVGVEIRRYGIEAQVTELAFRLGIPVVTTLMGRGLLAGKDSPVCGTYLGMAGDPLIAKWVEESDGLLLMGVILSDSNFGPSGKRFDVRKAMLAVNREVHLGYHSYHNIPLSALVQAMLDRLPFDGGPTSQPFVTQSVITGEQTDELKPQTIAMEVNAFLGRQQEAMLLASDIGDCLFTALEMDNRPMVAPGYYASMGFGVPAGLGIQITTGQRALIMVGDGAFQMTGWELGHCKRYGLDPIVVVLNNQSWEMIRVFQPNSLCSDLGDWPYAALAENLGGRGIRVDSRQALADALSSAQDRDGRFVLIEAMIPKGSVSPTLARFAERLKARRESA
jgi:indolepyruvate decarboxylase